MQRRSTFDPALRYVLLDGKQVSSDSNPLNFIQRDLVARAVVELGGSWRLVGGDRLGVLDRTSVLQVRGDAGGPEGVATGGSGESRSQGAAFNHTEHVGPRHRV